MMIPLTRRQFLLSAAALAAPEPYGATPSERQLRWHEMELYAFIHFTVNTFTDKEWGYGDESPALFHPTDFDPDSMMAALESAGMRGVILTCKHHDGFCLWPTRTTEHNIAKSPWKDGKGDMVREFAEAARRRKLKFGVYLSPWDRNAASYGTPTYVSMYREQLRELLTGYGPIFEVWHDGANGGDGFYGGAREKRRIDPRTYYDWPKTWNMVRLFQPEAVIFSDVGLDVRWVGNEAGYAGETCWATYDPVGEDGGAAAPGYTRYKEAPTGHRNAAKWLPPECDTSIRPGWFWHERENARVKTPAQLFDLYCRSVGRGGCFLLNVPPDRRGRFHENDVAALRGFGELVRTAFAANLAAKAKTQPSGARKLLDGDRYSFWSGTEVVLELPKPVTFSIVRLRENIRLGQRVEAFVLERWDGGQWTPFAEATSIGACRIVRLKEPVTADRVRVRITRSPVPPALSEFSLFAG